MLVGRGGRGERNRREDKGRRRNKAMKQKRKAKVISNLGESKY